MVTAMATFVLVHGGWHGGWCWKKVTPLLRVRGHEVLTPTLTGLGERAHLAAPDVGLETHVRDLLNMLEYENVRDVVLVGHSYAGMVITAVADRAPERIARLVYLDAFVPADGQALVDLLPPERRDMFLEQARTGEQLSVPSPPPELWGVADEDDLAWVRPRVVPQPLATFTEALHLDHADATPTRTYVACTASATATTFRPFAERVRADPAWRYREIATGHDAMITAPDALAALLLEAATDHEPARPHAVAPS
jgi:pimeloyl-ACP methyl ester carboxylesterase